MTHENDDARTRNAPRVCNTREYYVNVREVYIQTYRVHATTPDEAMRAVASGDGELMENSFEYSHTLDPEFWTVDDPSAVDHRP